VRPRSGHAGVECESFLTVDAVCALPRRHALARKRTIAVSDLVGVPLIAGAPGVFQQAVEESFARAGIEPRFVLMAQYTAARCGLVAEGVLDDLSSTERDVGILNVSFQAACVNA
jgi:LysR substrate binding domain